jgi:hypothetical protein
LARMREHYRKAFDALGLDKVRRFADTPSSTGEKLEQALIWIGEKDAEQQRAFMARSEAKMAEQTRIGRSAKNGAWIAAIFAIIATIVGIIALLK